MRIATALLVLALAPLVGGLATRTRSFLTGRRGAPMLQPYADLAKLLRKGAVYSTATTAVFRLGPLGYLVTTLAAALLVPFDARGSLVGFGGDIVLFAGLLAAGRFILVLAALDTGSSFEGMGSSREVTVASFAEPTLFLCLMVPMLATGQLSLGRMFGAELTEAWSRVAPALAMAGVGLFVLLLAEAGRVPIDDPATHLELTMIHEVMVLDHGGPDLGLIQYAGSLKLAMLGTLVVGVFVPRAALSPAGSMLLLVAGLAAVAVAVGTVESVMARLRLSRVPQLLVATAALAAVALILVLR